eukprot:2489036-Karenia_brevis.AAC.1
MTGHLEHFGKRHFLSHICSGVIQGCPNASILFLLAVDPWVRMCDGQIERSYAGIVRWCADDSAAISR